MKKIGIVLSTGILLSACVPQAKYKELEQKYYAALQGQSKTKKEVEAKEAELKMMQGQYLSLQEQQDALANKKISLDRDFKKLQEEYNAKLQAMEELEEKNAIISNAAEMSEEERRKLLNQLEDTKHNNKKILGELEQTQGELQEKIRRIDELENLINQQKESVSGLKNKLKNALKSYEGKGITVEEKEGNIYVSMDNKLLFPSASWVVEKDGIKALQDVSTVLANDKELNIIIQGHTDSDRYAGSGSVRDNWDLSVMRATAITKILQNEGVSPTQMTASGRSEYQPISDNSTAAGKAINRRVDIIIAPNLTEINKLLNEL